MPATEQNRFLYHEWAKRVWTAPELMMAKIAIVRCGRMKLSWKIFCPAMRLSTVSNSTTSAGGPGPLEDESAVAWILNTQHMYFWVNREFLCKAQRLKQSHGAFSKIFGLQVLLRVAACILTNQASDHLDKLFAFIPYLSHFLKGLPEINYTTTPKSVRGLLYWLR